MRALRSAVALTLLAPALTAAPAAADPLEFGPCPFDGAECAELSAPLGDGDRSIPIAISRVRATGTPAEYRGALLVNPGGPGGSGLEYAVSKGEKLPESVRRGYDIIGFDPRGVGRSAPLDCGELGGLFDHPAPEPVPAGEEAESRYLGRLRAMADDCLRHNPDASRMSTMSTARDLDRIRAALGEPKLNYLGVSYGTYLGAAYAAQFPDRVGRVVLDSAVGPDRWHDFDVRQAFAMLDQRDVLFEWVAAHPEFGLGDTEEQVRRNYSAARANLSGDFGPAEFDNLVYKTLSRTERWEPFARDLAAHLHEGTPLSPALPESDPESRNYEAALRTVKCADSGRPDEREVLGSIRALRAADPEPVLTGLEAATCAYWPKPRETARFGHPSMPPVLLTQADHDPTTPLDGARRMQARLPGSRMVLLHESYSHGVFASQRNSCVDDAAAHYLLTGALPAGDVDCRGPGLP
ncbi:alpha/beta hydrolase [Saccharopolyspora flava]|uniref:Alpha/beta hydrolase fold n=1 Tax=Saccharopolyspora flava TaxID=95161 RepID=A0A1I6NSV5_9PSEU|nr:alpha/beta hydrolase [Saccharopolyspora flava]SFS31011.1 alpha/beta hydrolase fold [Saccharopolyspora flava]